jgi:hypothetical protein
VRVLFAGLALVFGGLHLAGTADLVRHREVPRPALFGWIGAGVVAVAGAFELVLSRSAAAVAPFVLGAGALSALAVANGVWMHGRVTVSHHATRILFALVVIVGAIVWSN